MTRQTPVLKLVDQPNGFQHRFHAMVKPIGSSCNLNCTYCYYLSKGQLLKHKGVRRMADDMLEQHIRQYIEAQTGDEVIFSWQGGEPTLLGIDFFSRVIELQAKYKKPGQRIENDLQTNGILIDEQWARFLNKHNFLVGLSCDGPATLHDHYRKSATAEPTHGKVHQAAKILERHRVPLAALCVVNNVNGDYPLDVYRYLTRELRAWRVQFISCVEPAVFRSTAPQFWPDNELVKTGSDRTRPGHDNAIITPWSVEPEQWGRFLCKVWDDWYRRDFGKVHVDLFETIFAQSLGLPSQRCITSEYCGKGMAIEHDGEVFACDHYVYPEYRRGNIRETHWSEMAYSEEQQTFGFAKRDLLPAYCLKCDWLRLCWGECPKNRFVLTPNGERGLNYLCPGMKLFFQHIQSDLPEILYRIKKSMR